MFIVDNCLSPKKLRERFDVCNFDSGSILIQIPQVPRQYLEDNFVKNHGYFAYPPQGLLYLSSIMDSLNIESIIIDINYEELKSANKNSNDVTLVWKKQIIDGINKFKTPVFFLSFMFDPTYPQLKDVAKYIKIIAGENTIIIIGGVGATADPEKLVSKEWCDIVIVNEGENGILSLYKFLNGSIDTIPDNLFWMDKKNRIYKGDIVQGGEVNIDIRSQYKKLEIKNYCKVGSLNNFSRIRGVNIPFATILSRRGCRARCTFCSVRNFNGKSVRPRSVDNVIEEMKYLWDEHSIRHFEWLDDDLLYNKKLALDLFRRISDILPNATWSANNGLIAAAIDCELLSAMEESGCIGFTMGMESGNKETLRSIKKPATIETFEKFVNISKDFPGIIYVVCFILGLPNETFGQMLDSFRLALKAELDWANFFTYQPIKNTDAYLSLGGMIDDGDENIIKKSTTINFNPNREFSSFNNKDESILTGYDIFKLDYDSILEKNQIKEVWFTFNYIVNFIRHPGLTTKEYKRIKNAIKWFSALRTAYVENPAIDCVLFYLMKRSGDYNDHELNSVNNSALDKFSKSEYWLQKDEIFKFSSFLNGVIPNVNSRLDGIV